MNYKNISEANYKSFCLKEGSDYIASEFALKTILKIIKSFKVNKVLEIGCGIGSISDTVLKVFEVEYYGTENNFFCQEQLKLNVQFYSKLKLFSDVNLIQNQKFDFIIVDGYDDSISEISRFCNSNTIIYIEGARDEQTKLISKLFSKNKYVNIISLKKNKPYVHGNINPNNYVGGGQLIFTNPNFKSKMFWFNQKIRTFFIIKLRKIKNL